MVFSGDVKAAFDHLHPLLLHEMLVVRGVHYQLIAALMEECACMLLQPNFAGCQDIGRVSFSKCIAQGGTESPPSLL